MVVANFVVNVYRGPRLIKLNKFYRGRVSYARCGVLSGCIFADWFIKIFSIEVFDGICPQIDAKLDIYIDDLFVTIVGFPAEVVVAMAVALKTFAKAVEENLCCEVAVEKTATFASSAALCKEFSSVLSPLGCVKALPPNNLGIDYQAGRKRRGSSKSILCKRQKATRERTRKARELLKSAGHKARVQGLHVRSARPALGYGARVHGLNNS